MTRRSMVSAISSDEYGPRPDSSARISTSRDRSVGSQTLRCWSAASSGRTTTTMRPQRWMRRRTAVRWRIADASSRPQSTIRSTSPRASRGRSSASRSSGRRISSGEVGATRTRNPPGSSWACPPDLLAGVPRVGGPGALQLRGEADHPRDHLQAEASGHVSAAGVALDQHRGTAPIGPDRGTGERRGGDAHRSLGRDEGDDRPPRSASRGDQSEADVAGRRRGGDRLHVGGGKAERDDDPLGDGGVRWGVDGGHGGRDRRRRDDGGRRGREPRRLRLRCGDHHPDRGPAAPERAVRRPA